MLLSWNQKGMAVLLDCLRFDDEQPLELIFQERISQSCDHKMKLHLGRRGPKMLRQSIRSRMLKSSKSSVDFTIKFLDHAFIQGIAKEVETMNLNLESKMVMQFKT